MIFEKRVNDAERDDNAKSSLRSSGLKKKPSERERECKHFCRVKTFRAKAFCRPDGRSAGGIAAPLGSKNVQTKHEKKNTDEFFPFHILQKKVFNGHRSCTNDILISEQAKIVDFRQFFFLRRVTNDS